MALYPRLLGAVKFLEGDHAAAATALGRANELNPNDDLAWRTLALVRSEAGDIDGADEAIDRAVELHRADPTNLLLRLTFERLRSDDEGLATAGEVVHAWPWIVGLAGWAPFAGIPTTDALDAATERARNRRRNRPAAVELFCTSSGLPPSPETRSCSPRRSRRPG